MVILAVQKLSYAREGGVNLQFVHKNYPMWRGCGTGYRTIQSHPRTILGQKVFFKRLSTICPMRGVLAVQKISYGGVAFFLHFLYEKCKKIFSCPKNGTRAVLKLS